MFSITRKQFIQYSVLPGLAPRLKNLFASGFAYVPYFIALVYQSVRLLPQGHPYCLPVNIGKFGLRHVIAEAANNLIISRKNIDQLLLFVLILVGLALIFVQIALLGMSFVFQPALAQSVPLPTNFAGFFLTPNNPSTGYPSHDLAFMFLDMVFGVPDLFNSCIATESMCYDVNGHPIVNASDERVLISLEFPFPIHTAMHQLFQLYSMGLLIVATFITFYFIVTVVAETAQSGTAFGRRFNKVWAPLRIVVAFGLLVPVGYGLNSAQYIVLYAAKFGSGFASNGWALFNEALDTAAADQMSTIGATTDLISMPNVPEVGSFLQFMYVARTCAELENMRRENPDAIQPWLVHDPIHSPNALLITASTTYDQIINSMQTATRNPRQAIIRFGVKDPAKYPSDKGNVSPICGELIIPLTDPRVPGGSGGPIPDNPPDPGPEIMQRYYFYIVQELWFRTFRGDIDLVYQPTLAAYDGDDFNFPRNTALKFGNFSQDPFALLPPPEYKSAVQSFYSGDLNAVMIEPGRNGLTPIVGNEGAIEAQGDANRWFSQPSPNDPSRTILEEKGWAAAGIWYNKVAEMNGSISAAILNVPMASKYPAIMEHVKEVKKLHDMVTSVDTIFRPEVAGGEGVKYFELPGDEYLARTLDAAYTFWQSGGQAATSHTSSKANVFFDVINAFLGTDGLYSMRRNENVHPLAQLVGVGRSLVESAIRNVGLATLGGVGGLIGSIFSQSSSEGLSVLVGAFMTIAMISLTAGFILYYVVPFLPFIYFFFAVGGWVKGIFEAMVGAPLWALAHIRISGEGLPGQAAVSGYFLIFEIFIRPILIVFGMLASISIFAAFVHILNQTWDMVANVGGFDVSAEIAAQKGEQIDTAQGPQATFSLIDTLRNPIDEFFFTVMYAVICYLMAMSSFKLIDQVPNQILRWMGQSVSTFNDQREDPAQGMVGTASIGAQQTLQQVGGGYKGALQGLAKGSFGGKGP